MVRLVFRCSGGGMSRQAVPNARRSCERRKPHRTLCAMRGASRRVRSFLVGVKCLPAICEGAVIRENAEKTRGRAGRGFFVHSDGRFRRRRTSTHAALSSCSGRTSRSPPAGRPRASNPPGNTRPGPSEPPAGSCCRGVTGPRNLTGSGGRATGTRWR
jgi:hypothetical protein